MKYVSYEYKVHDCIRREISMFSELINHDDYANSLENLYLTSLKVTDFKIISAGFCHADINCFGRSETLKLESNIEDEALPFQMQYHLNIKFSDDEEEATPCSKT